MWPELTRSAAELAEQQFGVITKAQLQAMGATPARVQHWIARERLIPLHREVYGLGHVKLTREGLFLAAVLAFGSGAALSHRSAAAHWGLIGGSRATIDVSAPRSRVGSPGVTLHRPRRFSSEDMTEKDGIAVTTVARTVIDIAGAAPYGVIERAMNQAEVIGILDYEDLEHALTRAGRKRGIRKVRAIVATIDPIMPVITKSALEYKLLELLRQRALPTPECNAYVDNWQVDFVWRSQRLVVETDGRKGHSTALAFQRDRERDRTLQLAGFRVLRFTYADVTTQPGTVARSIRAALSSGAA